MKKHNNLTCQCCACKSYRGELKGKNHPMYIDGRKSKNNYCKICNKKLKDYKANECLSCSHKGKKSHFWIDGRCLKKYYCEDCKKEINYTAKRCHSCETKRRYKLNILNNKGRNNPNYKDGTGNYPYPSIFSKALKKKIFERDNYTCQNCNKYPCSHLSAHHIDYNRNNNKENNLITLCMKCNIRANYKRNYWQEYYINKIKK